MGNTLFKHIFLDEIDSTSSYLIKEHNNLPNFTFVSTNYQSKGTGREDRQWISAKGTNLLFSLLLKDKDLIKEYASISLCCAATIATYLISKGINKIEIKWPNDIYLNGKKLVGVLLEGNIEEYLVIGIGININQETFPNDLHHPATSIYLETKKKSSLDELKKEIFECLNQELNLKNIREKHYLNVVNKLNFLKNKIITLSINNEIKKGIALDILEDNSLLVDCQGQKIKVISGEIEYE